MRQVVIPGVGRFTDNPCGCSRRAGFWTLGYDVYARLPDLLGAKLRRYQVGKCDSHAAAVFADPAGDDDA